MKQIEINGKKYNIKYTIRSLFIFEQITKKKFAIESTLDNYIFFYSMILACNKDEILDWDEYINAMDENPNLIKEMSEVLEENMKKSKLFEEEQKESSNKKKTKRK